MKIIRTNIIIILFFAMFANASAQKIVSKPYFTIDSSFYSSSQDSLITSTFYDSLKVKAYKNKWTKELHNIIILPPEKPDADSIKTEKITDNYSPYKDKIIQNINFVKLDPFGTSIWDTTFQNKTLISKFGNAAHFRTVDRVLEQHLIINVGDKLDPYIIADNERLLRELKYLEDVRFIIEEDSLNPDYVNIVILTKDVWSKAFFVEMKDTKSGKIGLWDRNIFGIGNSFENNIHWDPDKSDFLGYDASYKSQNILGSFINGEVFYENVFETESYGLKVERKFFTPNTKFAGGFDLSKHRTIKNIWYSDISQEKNDLSNSYFDAWLGRSFLIGKGNNISGRRINLIVASRLIRNQYFDRPEEVREKLFHEYQSNHLWLNSLSLSSQSYYRSNLIYSFGRTEDIPNGWLANLSFGKEFGEFSNRYYSSFTLSHGDYFGNLGYINTTGSIGSYIHHNNNFEQGVLNLKLNYFTNLFVYGRHKLRYFVDIKYIKGINRFDLERININNGKGITGLSTNSVYGQQRFSLNMEAVIFSPASIYGFRFAFFGFNDFSLIGKGKESFSQLDNYSGYGIGIRIRNERLVFPTIQFRFAIYPGLEIYPEDHFNFSGEKKLNPNNFTPSAPNIIYFQ